MTIEEVHALIDKQSEGSMAVVNDHGLTLARTLVAPRKVSIIARQVENGRLKDETIDVWLVGEEPDGYKIVLRHDGQQFGLASRGFASDKHPILCGWYGDLRSTFLGM
jgi:hypothetical protein